MPMVWYIPPLSPVVDVARRDRARRRGPRATCSAPSTRCASRSSTWPSCSPPATLAPVDAACCAARRDARPTCATSTSGRDRATASIAAAVGMTEREIVRHVPAARHRQVRRALRHPDRVQRRPGRPPIEELACSLDVDGGPGMVRQRAVRRGRRAAPMPVAVETFHALRERQTSDRSPIPAVPRRPGQPAQLGRQGLPRRAVPARGTTTDDRRRPRPDAVEQARMRDRLVWQAASPAARLPRPSATARPDRPSDRAAAALSRPRSRARLTVASCDAPADHRSPQLAPTTSRPSTPRRRCSLYLTYYAARRHPQPRRWPCCGSSTPTATPGSSSTTPSSPDHLSVVLEFAATVGPDARPRPDACDTPRRHRAAAAGPGETSGSPYAPAHRGGLRDAACR